jgi:hypothetical protein
MGTSKSGCLVTGLASQRFACKYVLDLFYSRMTQLATLNFKIGRLRFQMKGMQSDIRLLTEAELDCTHASERLRRMQSDLLALIAERESLTCKA